MLRLSLILAALTAGTQMSNALVIRHDTPTLSYENYARESQFNASTVIVRATDAEYGLAGATAIDSRWGVHARHTLRSVSNHLEDGNQARLRGSKWNGYNNQGMAATNVLQVIHFDDDFTRFANAIDIALVQGGAASSTLRVAPLYNSWDEVGKVGSGASAANNRQDGNGNSRKTEAQNTTNSGRWYEIRWAGKNDVNQVNTQSLGSPANALLKCDLDHPTDTSKSVMGGNLAIDLEYGSMNGDSGSPIYLEKNGLHGQVAGVLSGGSGNVYGSTVVYVRTRPYKTWITDTILANPDNRSLIIDSLADQVLAVGSELALTATSASTEGPLTPIYSFTTAPTGASIDSATGAISWAPLPTQSAASHDFVVKVTEDGSYANASTTSFQVTVTGSNLVDFWSWSAAPPSWGSLTVSSGAPYGQASAAFPYLQGDTGNTLHQQITGTIPANANVVITFKAADFNQTWSQGGPIEFGLRSEAPTAENTMEPFLHSATAEVPNYNGDALADGLGNTGGNVDYSLTFSTETEIVNPWFVVRKNEDGDRFGIDDVVISYYFDDADSDGLPDQEEELLGTNPDLADTDGDGCDDGYEVDAGLDPLLADSDGDGFGDHYEITTTLSDPLDPNDPALENHPGIAINFVSAQGPGSNRLMSPFVTAGVAEVQQRNWNQAGPANGGNGGLGRITAPVAGTLVDSEGLTTDVTFSFTGSNTWSAASEELTPYGPLMAGYLDSNANNDATVTLTQIPYPLYEVYVYVGSDRDNRTGTISDGTTTYSLATASASPNEAGSFVQTVNTGTGNPPANYAVFSNKSSSSLTLTYSRGSGNGGIHGLQIIPLEVPNSYETWATNNGLDPSAEDGPYADSDGDGEANILEFALNASPLTGASRVELTPVRTESEFSLQFTQLKAADDLTITAEWSSDLENWSDEDVVLIPGTEDDTTRQMVAQKPVVSGETEGFLRIRVVAP
ncbi:Ig domain-containing protein [Roseibacillus persicicus]|uniref:Peptidase S1 domain-containing protein n=1 Tax=Roseibacillus persicicus TaxID=454148 RepID=A0A918TCW6_9BACT|nr:Ig domain-containing protein [Roseibacillus persicicus]GHC39933.1 hypothetical protein GCM10007100_00240 [Roseibacillus persicicus]